MVLIGWLAATAVQLGGQPAQQQQARPPAPTTAAGQSAAAAATPQDGPLDGVWPTEKMLGAMVDRAADDAEREYGLSAAQKSKFREVLLEDWSGFLEKHRPEVEPLLREYLQFRTSTSPPSDQRLTDWGNRAAPLIDRLLEQVDNGNARLRVLLSGEQQRRFDDATRSSRRRLDDFRRRVEGAQQGKFQMADWWEPPLPEAPPSPNRPSPLMQQAGAPDEIAQEMDAWDAFVTDFIRRQDFDDSQATAARSVLTEQKQRALVHRDMHAAEIIRLETTLAKGEQKDSEWVRAELQRLYGPIDALFDELRRRLDVLPTQRQKWTATRPQPDGG